MATLTLKDLKPFMEEWTEDEVTDSGVHLVGRLALQYTPDALYLGYGTHPVAFKNRPLNFMVIPDLHSLKFHSNYASVESRLMYCWTPQKELRRNPEGGYEWHALPGRVWPIAPVDNLCPSLQFCDLATLQSKSRPVLQRWCDRLLRRYGRAKTSEDLASIGREWDEIVQHHDSLQVTIPDAKIKKRNTAIAKVRLTQVA